MKRNVVIGCVVVGLCAVVAMASLGNGSTIQSKSFAAVRTSNEPCELYGKLDTNSIVSLQGGNKVRFVLEEVRNRNGKEEKTGEKITVYYDNPVIALTANFPAASHARAKGSFDPTSGEFVANSLITKCPSKYDKEMDLARQDAVRKWQKDSGLKPEPENPLETQSSRNTLSGTSLPKRF